MLLLVTDTSGKDGFVGLVRAGESGQSNGIELVEEALLAGGTFSAQLVPQVAALLAKHGFRKGDIGAFAVVSGPGSFTGLRVGLAAIKALAEILQKPIIPVSLLELVALSSHATAQVAAALDAGRGEVYVGQYDLAGGRVLVMKEQLLPKEHFLILAQSMTVATPDAQLAETAQKAGASVLSVDRPDSATIARLAWKKLQAGETVTPEQLDANYIRRSDAEIFAKPASSS